MGAPSKLRECGATENVNMMMRWEGRVVHCRTPFHHYNQQIGSMCASLVPRQNFVPFPMTRLFSFCHARYFCLAMNVPIGIFLEWQHFSSVRRFLLFSTIDKCHYNFPHRLTYRSIFFLCGAIVSLFFLVNIVLAC